MVNMKNNYVQNNSYLYVFEKLDGDNSAWLLHEQNFIDD